MLCHVLNQTATPLSGAENMAVDEALLESAVRNGKCALRLYRWSQPTLSLGYFQKPAAVEVFQTLRDLPRVRRLSGGGAIVHDCELTYSIALPACHPLARQPVELYSQIHSYCISILWELGAAAEICGSSRASADDPFLCFQRRDARDVILGPHKIIGSAQRRRKGALLQHGSLLVGRSAAAPELPGICDLVPGLASGVVLNHLEGGLAARLAAELGQPMPPCELTPGSMHGAQKMQYL